MKFFAEKGKRRDYLQKQEGNLREMTPYPTLLQQSLNLDVILEIEEKQKLIVMKK